MHIDPVIVLFGLGIGVLVGMTGIGGGSLMTPLLILVFGIKPVTAIGTDLAYGAVTKTLGGWRHWRQRTVDLPLSSWMALGSVPAAVLGVVALKAVQQGEKASFNDTILVAVGAALLLCGIAMLARRLLGASIDSEREHTHLTPARRVTAGLLGLAIGFVLGVTSAGSGALITIALIFVFRLSPRRVVGTDVFHAAILLWAAALAHMVAGDIDYGLAGTILLGSLPGVWVGSALSTRVAVGALRTSLGVLLIGGGLALVQKAGASIPTALLGAFPCTVAAILLTAHLRARLRGPYMDTAR
ncbi:MAG TPA: sulfite exporter TauE/SafE family protein [Solirubrobacteraceae bacterium]|nr:sulfite exporter TauE/SafE family protein [Solirubrobacteraceae bacterium]